MYTKLILSIVLASLIVLGLTFVRSGRIPVQPPVDPSPQTNLVDSIASTLSSNTGIEEVIDPGLSLPSDISAIQIKKYFRLGNIYFALVLKSSMNIYLELPADFTETFAGVLVASEGDVSWTKLLEIKDLKPDNANNPYYLLVAQQKLLLTVVDQNGAGSGEGNMKVFDISTLNTSSLESCYYFGENYNEPETHGDYFAYSTKFSQQRVQPTESCSNALFEPSGNF